MPVTDMAKIIFSRSSCMILDTNSELLLPYLLGYNSLLLPGFPETSSVAVGRVRVRLRGHAGGPRSKPCRHCSSPICVVQRLGCVIPASWPPRRGRGHATQPLPRARALHACRLRVCRRRPFSSDAEMLDARLDRNATSAISNVVVVVDSEGDGGVVYFCVPPLNHFSHSFFLSLQ